MYLRDLNHLIASITTVASIVLIKNDKIRFLTKNCTHANIIKNMTTDKNMVSIILINLNFDIQQVLTDFLMLKLTNVIKVNY